MASICHTKEEVGSGTPQVPTTDTRHLMERQRDKVGNEEVREKTTLQTLSLTIKERRLRWLGHVLRIMITDCPNRPYIGRQITESEVW